MSLLYRYAGFTTQNLKDHAANLAIFGAPGGAAALFFTDNW